MFTANVWLRLQFKGDTIREWYGMHKDPEQKNLTNRARECVKVLDRASSLDGIGDASIGIVSMCQSKRETFQHERVPSSARLWSYRWHQVPRYAEIATPTRRGPEGCVDFSPRAYIEICRHGTRRDTCNMYTDRKLRRSRSEGAVCYCSHRSQKDL